jgi:hypothetical protein
MESFVICVSLHCQALSKAFAIVISLWKSVGYSEAHTIACHSIIESVVSNRHVQYLSNRISWSDRPLVVMASQLNKIICELLHITAI